jgi:hypothetical protein
MKWFFIFPALIAASWVVMASQSALAFGLAQGVIVNGKGSVVYLMNPEGGIDAVNLSGGAVLATTTRGAKPLLLYGDALLAQAEGKDGVFSLVGLSMSARDLHASTREMGG